MERIVDLAYHRDGAAEHRLDLYRPIERSGPLPVVFYIHPREIDPAHPRLPMSRKRRFKSYVNLETTETKVRNILRDFPVTTFKALASKYPQLEKTHVG